MSLGELCEEAPTLIAFLPVDDGSALLTTMRFAQVEILNWTAAPWASHCSTPQQCPSPYSTNRTTPPMQRRHCMKNGRKGRDGQRLCSIQSIRFPLVKSAGFQTHRRSTYLHDWRLSVDCHRPLRIRASTKCSWQNFQLMLGIGRSNCLALLQQIHSRAGCNHLQESPFGS